MPLYGNYLSTLKARLFSREMTPAMRNETRTGEQVYHVRGRFLPVMRFNAECLRPEGSRVAAFPEVDPIRPINIRHSSKNRTSGRDYEIEFPKLPKYSYSLQSICLDFPCPSRFQIYWVRRERRWLKCACSIAHC